MALKVSRVKILLLEILLLTLVSSAPHGTNDQSSIATTTTTALKTALTTVFALGTIVSLAIVFFGCICCQHQRFKVNSSSNQSNGIPLPQHHSNNLETGNSSEFAIFPPPHAILKQPINQHDDSVTFEPLPDIRLRKFSSPAASGYFPKPAYFSSDVNKGLSLHDWFDDPQSNFPRSQLQYFSEVGSGWFGQVVEGEAQQITVEEKKTRVVVKILREDASPSEHIYFLHEVRLFRDLRHPNIMRLLGRCLEVDPFLVILEHGHMDLKTYLIQNRSNPESILQGGQLLRAACHVAKGLNHMHENNFIHTDLAARNCLVGHDRSVKIGDYGISVNAFKDDYYCVSGIALPIRWCSPESLVYSDNAIRTKELTPEANIWSFGVLLWEMIELGKLPYMEFSDDEVLQKTIMEQSLSLERPKTPCLHKDQLYQVMRLCWNRPQDRPSIQKISALLEHLFENKDVASDSIAFETRWNALQPVIREHNLSPKSTHDPLSVALTFETDFVPNNQIQKMTRNENFLSSDFDESSLRETSSSRCSLTQSFEANFGATISPSLQNLRGSLEDLALRNNSLERERKWDPLNVTNNPTSYNNKVNESKSVAQEQLDDKVINDQISEAIKDLDEFLAGEVTSSEVSKDTTPERNESGDEDEAALKNNFSRAKLASSERKNGSATTLTDIGTETGETLPKDSSDDSLHGHLLSDLDKQELSTPTNSREPRGNQIEATPLPKIEMPKYKSDIPIENRVTSEAIIHVVPDIQKDYGNLTEFDQIVSSSETNSGFVAEENNFTTNSQTSPIRNLLEKESQRDSAIVLESESSSSISSKTDEICLSNSPVNDIPITKLSSQMNLNNASVGENDCKNVEAGDKEEYVSTNASPSRALLSSFASESSALLSILNEPLTRGNPGSTTSMANRGNGGDLSLASASETNSTNVESLPLLTHPVKISQLDDLKLTQTDCGFRSELICNEPNDLNINTSSTNNYLSLSLDSLEAISSPCENVKEESNILTKNETIEKNIEESEETENYYNDPDDVMEGCTDDMELNVLSDSDLESLGEGYECSPRARKTSTPHKESSKPSVSLSESSLGQTYYTACDQSNLDESLKLEETSVLPFIEITLCEDIETDTIFDTCHSETPTLNDDPNSDTDNMNSESFEEQVGFLGQDSEGADRAYVEAVNSELIYRLTQSTPSDQSPSMLSLPSSENLKFDRDCFNETLFMRTDEGNCRPNYKNQLASFAFQKELNGITFAEDFESLNCEKPEFVPQYNKNHHNSLILNNVFDQSNPDVSSNSFSFKRGHRGSYDSSYLNSDFEQSNPEVTSNSFVFVNSNHSNSWFHPPPQYRECDNYERSSYYDEEESIVEDISEEFGAQAPKYQKPFGNFRNQSQEYQLEDILACLDDGNGGTDNPAYNEDDVETNPSIFSPVEDSGKYSSMADEDDNSIILDDLNQGAHCSDDMKDYLDDEVLIVDTETNEAVMLDSKERLTLAMEEENLAFYERQLYVNEVYDPDNYYGPTKLESIVEEFEENSNATSPAYSGNSNLSADPSPEKSFDHSGLQMKINDYGFNSQEELDKSISEACSCVALSEDEVDDDDECSTHFGARSVDSLESSPQIRNNPPILIIEGEEYLAGAETDDGFNDYEVEEQDDNENDEIERPGTSMLLAKQFQDFHSQSASETDEEDFISPKEKRDEVYTPDFDSDTDETSSTGTSESSTSGSFECSNDALDEEDDIVKSSTPLHSPKNSSSDTTPTSPVKIFSTAWDCTITPTKSAIKSPEKRSGEMKKSVSFHEEGPAYIFSYPPESDSDEEEGNEEAPEFTWHVDYSSYADWDFQPIDDEEIPEDIVEFDDIESPKPTPLAPINLSTRMYSITDISDDDLLDSLDSQTQMKIDNGSSLVNYGYPEMSEVHRSSEDERDARRIWLNYAVEEETVVNFEEGGENWPIDDFPEIVTNPDDNEDVSNILETVNPFIMDLSVELPNIDQLGSESDEITVSKDVREPKFMEIVSPSKDFEQQGVKEYAEDEDSTFKTLSIDDINFQLDLQSSKNITSFSLPNLETNVIEELKGNSKSPESPASAPTIYHTDFNQQRENNENSSTSQELSNEDLDDKSTVSGDSSKHDFLEDNPCVPQQNIDLPDICKDLNFSMEKSNIKEDEEYRNILSDNIHPLESATASKLKINQSIFNESKTLFSPVQEYLDNQENKVAGHFSKPTEDLTQISLNNKEDISNNGIKLIGPVEESNTHYTELKHKIDERIEYSPNKDMPFEAVTTIVKDKPHQEISQLLNTSKINDSSPKFVTTLNEGQNSSDFIDNDDSDTESREDTENTLELDPNHEIELTEHLHGITNDSEERIKMSLNDFNERAFKQNKHFGINANKRVYGEMQMNYNLNDRKDIVQDIPLEIDEILFEMERSFSMSDSAIASPEPVPLSDEYKVHQTSTDDKKCSLLKFREESLSFEGESSESKSSGTGSSLPKLNDSSPALSSDIDICESDIEDTREEIKETNQSDKYLIENNRGFIETDNLLNTTVVNGNFLSDDRAMLNYENNNEGRERFLHEVVNKDLVNRFKMDNNSSNPETISS